MTKPKVLIVDDSSTVRQLTRLILEKQLGCGIDEATDGVDALEKIASGSYSVVVTDINMPRMDGLGLISAVRAQLGSTVPIIIVTTRGSEVDRDKGLALGANSYITKPIDGAVLTRTVMTLMGGSPGR